MHRRLSGICEAMEIDPECFRGKLHMRSAVAEDSIFATVGPDGRVKPTKLLKRINREIAAVQPRLVILDTLANLHALDPNNQEQARAFVGFLVEVAQKHDCSVLLLAHPSRSGMATGGGDGFRSGGRTPCGRGPTFAPIRTRPMCGCWKISKRTMAPTPLRCS